MDNRAWSDADAYFIDMIEDADRFTSDYRLDQCISGVGHKFLYVFDFGDDWRFQCRVLKILDEATPEAAIIKSIGEAPAQYGYEEDEFEEEDDSSEDGDGDE